MIQRQEWFQAKGDETLALDWPLTEDSHVWEIGGFEGRWAKQISDKFHCWIDIYEPQRWAVERMYQTFRNIVQYKKVSVHPYGLWTSEGPLGMGKFETDGCSLLETDDKQRGTGWFLQYGQVLFDFQKQIDLALMNIEGGEYELLPAMIESKWIRRFNYFWCQFNLKFEKDGSTEKIMRGMEATHDLLWDCFPTAVAWKRKEAI